MARTKAQRGRRTYYLEEYADMAFAAALSGKTDAQLAARFEVSESCFKKWCQRHAKFGAEIRRGKDAADEKVVRALFIAAIGQEERTTKRVLEPDKEGELRVVQEIREHVPADVGAAKLWLRNRCGWEGDAGATATATAAATAASVSVVAGLSDELLGQMRLAGRARHITANSDQETNAELVT